MVSSNYFFVIPTMPPCLLTYMWHCSITYFPFKNKTPIYIIINISHPCTPLTHTLPDHLNPHPLCNFRAYAYRECQHPITTHNSILGAGLPSVSTKLVSKMESRAFIEMADLLPEWLGTYYSNKEPKTRAKKPTFTNIMEWLQCFAAYAAVWCQKQPQHIRDFMGYQALIIEAYMVYKGDCWMGYKYHLWQITASQLDRSWTSIDPMLWNLVFSGQAKLHDVCTASASYTTQMTASLLQEASHNVPTNFFLLSADHNASQSACSGMIIHPTPVHTETVRFNTYATYVPTTLWLLMCQSSVLPKMPWP